MKWVHRLVKHSAEVVFVISGDNIDSQNLQVFILMTHSPAGALPLSALMLPNEQCETITSALHLYLSLLDDQCFAGREEMGPVVFMTDILGPSSNHLYKAGSATCKPVN